MTKKILIGLVLFLLIISTSSGCSKFVSKKTPNSYMMPELKGQTVQAAENTLIKFSSKIVFEEDKMKSPKNVICLSYPSSGETIYSNSEISFIDTDTLENCSKIVKTLEQTSKGLTEFVARKFCEDTLNGDNKQYIVEWESGVREKELEKKSSEDFWDFYVDVAKPEDTTVGTMRCLIGGSEKTPKIIVFSVYFS